MTDDPARAIDREVGSLPETEHEIDAADRADAALRDLDVGVRVDGPVGSAEIRTDETAETLVQVTRTRGGVDGEQYRWACLSFEAATAGDGEASASLLVDDGDAAEVRELAEAIATVADYLEGADE